MNREYVELINTTILDIKQNINMADKNQLREYIKFQIRTDTITYSCRKAKENKKT